MELDDDEDGLSDCEGDCLDDEEAAYPGAQEVCDGLDDDCDGALPGDEADVDGDGEMACEGDCDDTDRTSAHVNFEVCDGVDNDCNGIADDACIVCDIAIPNDFGSIQEGLDAASTGAVVCVGPGTWSGPIHFNGVDVTLLGTRGPLETIIDGGGDGSAVQFASGEGPLTKMQGFTVEGGHPRYPPAVCGGGVRIVGASPTIVDLVVQENRSEGWGGGICVDSGDPTFSHLLVQENYANYGGGVYLIHSNVSLDNVTISSNEGGADAGGLCTQDSTVSLTNARIVSNSTSGDGGGAWFTSTDAVLTNVVIMSNSADLDAGLIGDGGSTVTIANSTIAYNSSERGAVGVAMSDEATAELRNVVFVYNTAINNRDAPPSEYSQYSDFYGNSDNGSGGADNLAVDPLLYTDAEHLESSSPLVDAGDPAIFDPDGSRSDIGAFGGPGADNWDLDGDGYPAWWLAGAYDAATSPGSDCDDDDAAVYPGAGC